MSESDREIALRLSTQRALLGAIPPTVATITCGWDDKDIVLEFIVDSDFPESDREHCKAIATEVVADFSDANVATVFKSPPQDGPMALTAKRWCVYRRFHAE